MSTINKTFLRVLLAIACCIALAFSLLPQAEAEAALHQAGIGELQVERVNLEDAFIGLTGKY